MAFTFAYAWPQTKICVESFTVAFTFAYAWPQTKICVESFTVAFTFAYAWLKTKVCVESFTMTFTFANILSVNGYVTKPWLQAKICVEALLWHSHFPYFRCKWIRDQALASGQDLCGSFTVAIGGPSGINVYIFIYNLLY